MSLAELEQVYKLTANNCFYLFESGIMVFALFLAGLGMGEVQAN